MKKRVLITSLIFAFSWSYTSAETLRFGIDLNYPPFSKQGPNGEPQGFDVEIAYALCAAMKVTCQLVVQEWNNLIPALNANKFDAILSSMQITEERKKMVDFTQKYYTLPSRLITRRGVNVEMQTSFKGKKIGVLRTTTQEKFARDYWGQAGAIIIAYNKIPEAWLDLKSGKLEAVFADNVVGEQEFLAKPPGNEFTFTGPYYTDKRYFALGASIAVRKGNHILLQRLNSALDTLQQNGTYQNIQKKFFRAHSANVA